MQKNYTRTTITIPQDLLLQTKHYALENQTSVSQLIQTILQKKVYKSQKNKTKKHSILDLAGTLDLGGTEPPSRLKLYEKHIRRKMGL